MSNTVMMFPGYKHLVLTLTLLFNYNAEKQKQEYDNIFYPPRLFDFEMRFSIH